MRTIFVIGTFVGAVALAGGCSSSNNGNTGGAGNTDGGAATGGGGTGGSGGSANNCAAYCSKLEAAGCPPANCATDCAAKATCIPQWNSVVACVANTGTVTCSGTTPSVPECTAQASQYDACVNGGTGATGGGGTGGGGTASCVDMCETAVYPDPVPGSDPACYCDPDCVAAGDCCADQATACPPPSNPGTCKKFCCAASDCASGEACNAFDATKGTLGVCGTPTASDAGTGGSAGGTGTDAGPTPDAGPPGDGGITLPAGCAGTLTVECNPLTNAGCDTASGVACDYGNNSSVLGLYCYTDGNTVAPGGTCDNANGPWCSPTGGSAYHCTQ